MNFGLGRTGSAATYYLLIAKNKKGDLLLEQITFSGFII